MKHKTPPLFLLTKHHYRQRFIIILIRSRLKHLLFIPSNNNIDLIKQNTAFLKKSKINPINLSHFQDPTNLKKKKNVLKHTLYLYTYNPMVLIKHRCTVTKQTITIKLWVQIPYLFNNVSHVSLCYTKLCVYSFFENSTVTKDKIQGTVFKDWVFECCILWVCCWREC
jgi:hypothetical protein